MFELTWAYLFLALSIWSLVAAAIIVLKLSLPYEEQYNNGFSLQHRLEARQPLVWSLVAIMTLLTQNMVCSAAVLLYPSSDYLVLTLGCLCFGLSTLCNLAVVAVVMKIKRDDHERSRA